MRRYRLKVIHLMAIVVLSAISLAVLKYPTRTWASVLFTLTVALPLASILKAIASPSDARLPWIGFALFGLVFLVISFRVGPSDFAPTVGHPVPDPFPAKVFWMIGPNFNPNVAYVVEEERTTAAATGGVWTARDRAIAYRNCSASLSVLMLSVVGYVLGDLMTKARREASPSA